MLNRFYIIKHPASSSTSFGFSNATMDTLKIGHKLATHYKKEYPANTWAADVWIGNITAHELYDW